MMDDMSTTPVLSFDLDVIPLASIDDADLHDLVTGLSGPSAPWHAQLLHPARPMGVAAVVDGEVVGVARLVRRTDTGREVLVAVADAWRRQGIGGRLWSEAVALVEARGERALPAIEPPTAPVRALPQRARLHAADALAGLLLLPGRVA
jgi:GNAT superfamily N-acetyltransferase